MLHKLHLPNAFLHDYPQGGVPIQRWTDASSELKCEIRQLSATVFSASVSLPKKLNVGFVNKLVGALKKDDQFEQAIRLKIEGGRKKIAFGFIVDRDFSEDDYLVHSTKAPTVGSFAFFVQEYLNAHLERIAKRIAKKKGVRAPSENPPIWLASAVQCSRKVYLEAVGYTPKGRTKPLVGKQLVQVALSSQDSGFLTSRKIGVELRVPGSEHNWAAVIKLKNQKSELDIKTNSLVVEAGGQKLRIYLEF